MQRSARLTHMPPNTPVVFLNLDNVNPDGTVAECKRREGEKENAGNYNTNHIQSR